MEITGAILLLFGSFFIFTSAVGLFRLPDVFTRLHAAGVADVFGALLALTGVAFLSASWAVAGKLALLGFFLLLSSPTACHAIIQAALSNIELPRKPKKD